MQQEPVKKRLEVCLTPAVYKLHEDPGSIVVVIDILRASSAICTAFANGAEYIIPVADLDIARSFKQKGYMVAAERDGYVLDFADFGNSPFNFTPGRVRNKTIVYSTTNCTRIIDMASLSKAVVIGSFLNLTALSRWLADQQSDVLLLCSGWKDKVNLEDTICAGAFASQLLGSGKYTTICDSTHISIDLWNLAKDSPLDYIEKAAQRSRLRDKGLDDCLEYCLVPDSVQSIPFYENGKLRDIGTGSVSGKSPRHD
ncbi:MAG: 2-phosphosulfolactate phosphatase [Bacteroidales bacterium]